MSFIVAAMLVVALWIYLSVRKKRRASTSHSAADLAAAWFAKQNIDRDSIMFNTYTSAGLARNAGATVIAGVGWTSAVDDVGFVVEVLPGRGVVAGELIRPAGVATWDKTDALTAMRIGRPLMDVMLDRAATHNLINAAGRSKSPPWTVEQWRDLSETLPTLLRTSFESVGVNPEQAHLDDWCLGYSWGFFVGHIETFPETTGDSGLPELLRAGFDALYGKNGSDGIKRFLSDKARREQISVGATAGEKDASAMATATSDDQSEKMSPPLPEFVKHFQQ